MTFLIVTLGAPKSSSEWSAAWQRLGQDRATLLSPLQRESHRLRRPCLTCRCRRRAAGALMVALLRTGGILAGVLVMQVRAS